MTGVETCSFVGRGGIIWDQGDSFSKFIDRGSQRGSSRRDTWTGSFSLFSLAKY